MMLSRLVLMTDLAVRLLVLSVAMLLRWVVVGSSLDRRLALVWLRRRSVSLSVLLENFVVQIRRMGCRLVRS
jgi:hypothetical protein